MRKFIVHTRAIPGHKGGPFVIEVEGEMIAAIEDPSVMWLPEGEFRFRILKPEFLYEPHEIKQPDGSVKKVMLPPVYASHGVYWNEHQAAVAAERILRQELDFEIRKGRIESYTDEELKAKYAEIQYKFLTVEDVSPKI